MERIGVEVHVSLIAEVLSDHLIRHFVFLETSVEIPLQISSGRRWQSNDLKIRFILLETGLYGVVVIFIDAIGNVLRNNLGSEVLSRTR